jgi:hypothetical protein
MAALVAKDFTTLIVLLRIQLAMRAAERETRAAVEMIQKSCHVESAQVQGKAIHRLTNEIRMSEKRNEELNNQLEELEAESDRRRMDAAMRNECESAEEMTSELEKKRRKFYDKCDELIEIQSQQAKEVAETENMQLTESSCRSRGNEEWALSCHLISREIASQSLTEDLKIEPSPILKLRLGPFEGLRAMRLGKTRFS